MSDLYEDNIPEQGDQREYGEQPGNAEQTQYGNQSVHAEQTQYEDQSEYAGQPQYGNQSVHAEQPQYGNQSVHAEQPQYGDQSEYAGQTQELHAETAQPAGEEKKPEAVTYSWVSPKLRQEQEAGEQPARNPWESRDAGAWRTETGEGRGPFAAGPAGGEPYSSKKVTAGSIPGENTRQRRKRKTENGKAGGTGYSGTTRKWAATVSMGVVFGLVAGLVFTGVSALGTRLTSAEEVQETASSEVPAVPVIPEASGDDHSAAVQKKSSAAGGTVADVAAQCMPSLVTISTISVEQMQSFFGQTQQYEVEGAGTGVIVGQNDTELLIATNNHVVYGANSLSVGFIDETAVEGAVKGYDASTDLAVVAVKLEDISSETMDQIRICEMGNSDDLVLGEQVVAIGNALGYGQSVTSGYISAFDRELELSDGSYSFTSSGLIQTDASINSGNSGGALLNMQGQLIGINEAKSSGSSSSASVDNIGFAIPIAKAEPILEDLMALTTRTKVDEEQSSYIGITCADVSEETAAMYNMPTGVCLTSIMEGSPAEKAGLKKGDVLTQFDGRKIETYSELVNTLQYYSAGETVEVVVQRSDEGEYSERTVSLTLGSASDMPEAYQSGEENSGDDQEQQSRRGWSRP